MKQNLLDASLKAQPHQASHVATTHRASSNEPTPQIRILLAVLTTGARSGPLRTCVDAISRLRPAAGVELSLLLVQNGAEATTRELTSFLTVATPTTHVALEPQVGIPFARNRAIAEAIARSADYLAFIDDDAAPDEDWLIQAIKVLRATKAEAVTGPQFPVFPRHTPHRLLNAAVYRAARHDSERPCTWAASNNVIFSIDFVKKHGLTFNETFTTGGSDKEYFKRFSRVGGIIRWAPRAIVREPVTSERLNLRWAVRRSWRLGTGGYRIEVATTSRPKAVTICVGKGVAYLAGGIAMLPLTIFPKHPGYVNGLCYLAHGAGFILGLTARFRPKTYV